MKKFIIIMLFVSFSYVSYAQKFSIKSDNGFDINYKIIDKKNKKVNITSIKNSNNQSALTIHSTVSFQGEEYTVSKIGDRAFAAQTDVDSLIIPFGSISIDEDAFNSSSFKYADISGVVSVGEDAFSNCKNLRKVIFSENIQTIEDNAFKSCYNLSLKIRNDFNSIHSAIDKQYRHVQKNDWIIVDSIKIVDKFNLKNDKYTYTIIDSIPGINDEQIFNEALSILSQEYTISSSNKDSKSIIAQKEIKNFDSRTDYTFGMIYNYDLFYTIRVDCKNERIRVSLFLQKYNVEKKNWSGKGRSEHHEERITPNEKSLYLKTCNKAISAAESIIQLVKNNLCIDDNVW